MNARRELILVCMFVVCGVILCGRLPADAALNHEKQDNMLNQLLTDGIEHLKAPETKIAPKPAHDAKQFSAGNQQGRLGLVAAPKTDTHTNRVLTTHSETIVAENNMLHNNEEQTDHQTHIKEDAYTSVNNINNEQILKEQIQLHHEIHNGRDGQIENGNQPHHVNMGPGNEGSELIVSNKAGNDKTSEHKSSINQTRISPPVNKSHEATNDGTSAGTAVRDDTEYDTPKTKGVIEEKESYSSKTVNQTESHSNSIVIVKNVNTHFQDHNALTGEGMSEEQPFTNTEQIDENHDTGHLEPQAINSGVEIHENAHSEGDLNDPKQGYHEQQIVETDTTETFSQDRMTSKVQNVAYPRKDESISSSTTETTQYVTTRVLTTKTPNTPVVKHTSVSDRIMKQSVPHILSTRSATLQTEASYGASLSYAATIQPTIILNTEPKLDSIDSYLCKGDYSKEAVVTGIIGGMVLGGGLVFLVFYLKRRCSKYIKGDYRRVPLEYDFELNPRFKNT